MKCILINGLSDFFNLILISKLGFFDFSLENGVRFKLENNTSKTLYCKIVEVTANWTDGKTRTKDIYIKWIPAGEERSEIYWQTDNYSTMKGWSFEAWRVSADLEDLE
jgi:hypothetical protein